MKIKDDFAEIKQELSNCNPNTLHEFMKVLPCYRKNYFIPIKSVARLPNVKIIIKGRQVGHVSPQSFWCWSQYQGHVICASASEFWERWNRFKKLRVFL